jgi:hypothetical protein
MDINSLRLVSNVFQVLHLFDLCLNLPYEDVELFRGWLQHRIYQLAYV